MKSRMIDRKQFEEIFRDGADSFFGCYKQIPQGLDEKRFEEQVKHAIEDFFKD